MEIAAIDWRARRTNVTGVRNDLRPRLVAIEGMRFGEGTAVQIVYNDWAVAWAGEEYPRSEGRRFATYRGGRGDVVRSRARETTLITVAFDVTVTTDRGQTRVTAIVLPT